MLRASVNGTKHTVSSSPHMGRRILIQHPCRWLRVTGSVKLGKGDQGAASQCRHEIRDPGVPKWVPSAASAILGWCRRLMHTLLEHLVHAKDDVDGSSLTQLRMDVNYIRNRSLRCQQRNRRAFRYSQLDSLWRLGCGR